VSGDCQPAECTVVDTSSAQLRAVVRRRFRNVGELYLVPVPDGRYFEFVVIVSVWNSPHRAVYEFTFARYKRTNFRRVSGRSFDHRHCRHSGNQSVDIYRNQRPRSATVYRFFDSCFGESRYGRRQSSVTVNFVVFLLDVICRIYRCNRSDLFVAVCLLGSVTRTRKFCRKQLG